MNVPTGVQRNIACQRRLHYQLDPRLEYLLGSSIKVHCGRQDQQHNHNRIKL